MATFRWDEAFVWDCSKKKYHYKTLRRYIDKYGVNTPDKYNSCVFLGIGSMNIEDAKKTIDVIFEYKPDLLAMSHGHIRSCDVLRMYDCYVLHKFIEQDTSYRLLRCPLKILSSYKGYAIMTYPSFIVFLPIYMRDPYVYQKYDQEFIAILKDHYHKSVTFFEMMKHKLIE